MTIEQAFRDQASACDRLGSPFMARALNVLAEMWDHTSAIGERFGRFSGDVGSTGHSLPLRLMGGFHALVLTNRCSDLVAVYPPEICDDDALQAALNAAMAQHTGFLLDWIERPPQTNEVGRSAALIAMAHVATRHFNAPITLSELGASGGLNLMWDRYALKVRDQIYGPQNAVLRLTPDWHGPFPDGLSPKIQSRAGVDLTPLDLKNADDVLRLNAYLWPDQPERLARARAATGALNAHVVQDDAITWLENRLSEQPTGQLHIIQNTVAWQYFPKETQTRGVALIEAQGARATNDRPLAWMQMESDGVRGGQQGAALTLRLWPGNITLHLGRADFHGRWIRWSEDTDTQNLA